MKKCVICHCAHINLLQTTIAYYYMHYIQKLGVRKIYFILVFSINTSNQQGHIKLVESDSKDSVMLQINAVLLN